LIVIVIIIVVDFVVVIVVSLFVIVIVVVRVDVDDITNEEVSDAPGVVGGSIDTMMHDHLLPCDVCVCDCCITPRFLLLLLPFLFRGEKILAPPECGFFLSYKTMDVVVVVDSVGRPGSCFCWKSDRTAMRVPQ